MKHSLRIFQEKLKSDIYKHWDDGRENVMPVSPTGSGKTVVLASIIEDQGASSSLAIAHRQELVGQISLAMARNGIRHRLISPEGVRRIISSLHIMEFGHSYIDQTARCGVGGVDTILRMDINDPWFRQVRLLVQDEGHHTLKDNKWGKAAAMFGKAKGLYPTATAIRADGKGLGRHADGIIDALALAPGMREVIDMGFLTDYKIFCPKSDIDVANVQVSQVTGDFNQEQLRKEWHKSRIVGDVVENYLNYAPGKLAVVFCVDVEGAGEMAEKFRQMHVSAEVVSAKTPDSLRASIIRRFRDREIQVLVNVDLFGEGFDLPAIECVIFARPTESFSLYCQQFGRVLRLMVPKEHAGKWHLYSDKQRVQIIAGSEKPYGTVIDHVGNVIRHMGPPDKFVRWTLDRRDRKARAKSDAIPYRVCPSCAQPYERVFSACPFCTYKAEPKGRSAPEMVDGDLLEMDEELLRKLRGEIGRIDGELHLPAGLEYPARVAAHRRHDERKQAQAKLREAISWWAGLDVNLGYKSAESYRRFWFKFGIDVLSAQALGAREAEELTGRICGELQNFNLTIPSGNV